MKSVLSRVCVLALVTLSLAVLAPRAVRCQSCGLKPLKPLPPLGCRDVYAQCVVDSQGNASWQWVCVR
jgi:hypothetical protein